MTKDWHDLSKQAIGGGAGRNGSLQPAGHRGYSHRYNQGSPMRTLFFTVALLPHGWASDVVVSLDAAGAIANVETGAVCPADAERLAGIAVPGIPNLHSHAHQRAIAGRAERSGDGLDSFWTWRETMYGAVVRMTPDDFQAVAAQLYVEMAKAGYTAVAEFHYLHHDADGRVFADPAEMSHRVILAAREAGLSVTLLPVLYAAKGFGGGRPGEGQRRFVMAGEAFQSLMAGLRRTYGDASDVRLGVAPHSLRAVPPALLAELLTDHPTGPIHLHIAEQRQEVEDCLAHTSRRPIDWLFDHHHVDDRWCLVHATHGTPHEIARIAASGAVVGLCPTTEANLGDGIFPGELLLAGGGRFGVGSDSHVSVSPVEELRWLEYTQRLTAHRRTVLAGGPHRSTARSLLDAAWEGGARACGMAAGRIAPGQRADLIVLDGDHPLLAGRSGDDLLDSWIFAGNAGLVRDVVVGGRIIVRHGRHAREEQAAAHYKRAVERLLA
jgi:formimidoylglutamate deiminase